MCGIAGWFVLGEINEEQYKAVFDISTQMFIETMIRGKDSAGFAFMNSDNKIKWAKGPIDSKELVKSEKWLKVKDLNVKSMIMHCRFGTKGSEMENENNHPLIINESEEDQLALIHNGCINNDVSIRGENKEFNWNAEVDTEVIPVLIHENLKAMASNGIEITKELVIAAIKESTKDLSGSFACAMLNKNTPNSLYFFKHNNPIVLAYCKELNTVFFASTESIINNAFAMNGENVENSFGLFDHFKKYTYTTKEMAKNEMIVLTREADEKVDAIQDKFEAKEYSYSTGGYNSSNNGKFGQGEFFGDFNDDNYYQRDKHEKHFRGFV